MSWGYWLGVFTPPAMLLAAALAMRVWFHVLRWFADRGMTANLKMRRRVDEISDYALRRDIWWERAFGPVFAGGWYRKSAHYGAPRDYLFTRWIGLGSINGPCLCGYWKRAVPSNDESPDESPVGKAGE